MDLVLFSWTGPNNCVVLLVVIFHIRATYLLPTECTCLHESDCSVHNTSECTLHMYIENKVTVYVHCSESATSRWCVVFGAWRFFCSLIPLFCVSSYIKTVHALALEYLVAFHPIFLILLPYMCKKFHDNNFTDNWSIRPVVWLWKPFYRHFVHFRRRWDSKASIVIAFTTILLLTFSKVLFVSFTPFYYIYVLLVILIVQESVIFIMIQQWNATLYICSSSYLCLGLIFPTILLILYPMRLFRICVSCCGFRRWHVLQMFKESFQGQYKDGTTVLMTSVHHFSSFGYWLWAYLQIAIIRPIFLTCTAYYLHVLLVSMLLQGHAN